MDIISDSPLAKMQDRLNNYKREQVDLERKLAKNPNKGSRGKWEFRLNDIIKRLIPQTERELQEMF